MKLKLFVLASLLAGACSLALAQTPANAPQAYPNQIFAATNNGNLAWDVFIPPPSFPPPWNVVLVIHEGDFHGGSRADVDNVASDLAMQGFAAAAIDYRSDEVPSYVDGQTHPVYAPPATPSQPGDVQLAILAARFPTQPPLTDPATGKSRVTGWVGAVGGSSGAAHALWCAATGTLQDTKLNAAALLSCPSLYTDERSLDDDMPLGCPAALSSFKRDVIAYCHTKVNASNFKKALMAGSPWYAANNTVSPLIAFASKSDPITPPQLKDMKDLLKQLGLLKDTANYSIHQLPGSGHGFQYWDDDTRCGNTPGVMMDVVSFLQDHITASQSPN